MCLQVLGNKDPAYVNAELIAKDPNCRCCEVCDKANKNVRCHMSEVLGAEETRYLTICH